MNYRKTLVTLAALAALGAAGSALALHKAGLPNIASTDSQNCQRRRCSFTATFARAVGQDEYHVIRLLLSMQTRLRRNAITNTEGDSEPFSGGDTLQIPIVADGETAGMAARFFDTPLLEFRPGGVVRGETTGLHTCALESLVVRPEKVRCSSQPASTLGLPVEGSWEDAWAVYPDPDGDGVFSTEPSDDFSCSTNSAGDQGTCDTPAGFVGKARIVVRRTVRDFRWRNGDVSVVAEQFPTWGATNPFPGTMQSAAVVEFTAPGPDLVVPSITWDPPEPVTGDVLDFSAVVKNQGSVQAPNRSDTRLTIYLDGDLEDPNKKVLITPDKRVRRLQPGADQTVTWGDAWEAEAGDHLAQACADVRVPDEVDESVETNNCTMKALPVLPPVRPDYLGRSRQPGACVAGGDLVLRGDAVNRGEKDVAANQRSWLQFLMDGSEIFAQQIAGLASGEHSALLDTTWEATAGDHTFAVCADRDDEITESDEANNCRPKNFFCRKTGVDYATQNLACATAAGHDVRVGDAVKFQGEVRNLGIDVGDTTATRLSIDTDQNGSFDTTPTDVSTPGLTAGQTSVAAWEDAHTFTAPGTYHYRVCADATGLLAGEDSEDNNCVEAACTVSAPRLPLPGYIERQP